MHSRSFHAFLAIAALSLVAPLALGQDLQQRIDSLIRDGNTGGARVGVRVIDLATGRSLAVSDPDGAYIPASNMKLLSSGAALAVLGADHVFRTELYVDGDRVIVRGSGDPAFGDPEILRNTEPRMTLDDFMARLVEATGNHLEGGCSEIIVDDRIFDRTFVHPTWDPNDLNKWYAPQVSGLSIHGNLLAIFAAPSPAGPGSPPTVQTQPSASWLRIDNNARTTSSGANTHWPAREPTANRFTLYGDVRAAGAYPVNTPTHDNALLFGQLLADGLIRSGITVGGQSALGLAPPTGARTARPDEVLDQGKLVAVVTTPLSEVLTRCNTDSANLYAEAMLKLIGHEVTNEAGSWANGSSVLRMLLEERLGSGAAASTVVTDGSGLSHDNRVSPRTLTDWLAHFAAADDLREPFMLSLATPGRGTFAKRFREISLENRVAGKSGVLTGVRTLSGYVVGPDGRTVAFAVLVNDLAPKNQRNGTLLADRILGEIDDYVTAVSNSSASVPGG